MPKKILVIEDEEELGRSLKKFLEQHGYQVAYFNQVTRESVIHVESPDLIITDLLMPQIHGFDICKKVKNDPMLKDIPMIVVTAVYKDSFHKMEVTRLGVEEFVEKPFKFNDLLNKIKKLLGEESSEVEDVPVISASPAASVSPVVREVQATPGTKAAPQEAQVPVPVGETPKSGSAPAAATMVNKEVIAAASPPKSPAAPPKPDISNKPSPDKKKEREEIIQEQFQAMQQDFVSALPAKIKEVEDLWNRILSRKPQQDIKELLNEFRRKVHGLSGSGPTFGFPDFGESAGQLELLADMIIVEGDSTIPRRKNKINELLDKLRHHPIVSTEMDVMRQEIKI